MTMDNYEYVRLKLDWSGTTCSPVSLTEYLDMEGCLCGFSKDDQYLYAYAEEVRTVKKILKNRNIAVLAELPMKRIPKPKME